MASNNPILALLGMFLMLFSGGGENVRRPAPQSDHVFAFHLKVNVPADSRDLSAINATVNMLVKRLVAAELRHSGCFAPGKSHVVIIMPGMDTDEERRLTRLLNTLNARLEFRLVHKDSDKLVAEGRKFFRRSHPDGGEKDELAFLEENAPAGYRLMPLADRKDNSLFGCYVSEKVELDGGYVDSVDVGKDMWDRPQIGMHFNTAGAEKFKRLTGANIGRRLAVVFNGKLYGAPLILAELGDRIEITGNFSGDVAEDICAVLRSGAAPFGIELDTTAGDDPQARYSVGWCYEHGAGVPADLPTALEYYRQAAAQGFAPAQKALERLEKR